MDLDDVEDMVWSKHSSTKALVAGWFGIFLGTKFDVETPKYPDWNQAPPTENLHDQHFEIK